MEKCIESAAMTFIQLMQALKAASGDGDIRGRRVRPSDLDIYNEPDFASKEERAISELRPPHLILTYVSAVRKRVWKFKDVTLKTYDRAEGAFASIRHGILDAYEKARSDPLSMLRPGCIAFGVLAGAVVHGRGRKPILRLTTATVAGTLVASVAYPDKAMETTKQIYYSGKEASISLVNLAKKWMEQNKTVEVKEVSESMDEIAEKVSDDSISPNTFDAGLQIEGKEMIESSLVVLDANGEEVCLLGSLEREAAVTDSDQKDSPPDNQNGAIPLEDNQTNEPLVDYGQSNPEDNDMYSTRS